LNKASSQKTGIDMFIVWRGWGVLLLLGALIGALVSMFAVALLEGIIPSALFPAFVTLGATLAGFQTMRWLEKSDKGREVIDAKTGETILLKRGDSIFFIRVRYWAYALVALTLVVFGMCISSMMNAA
jgi:hypothetical protein|tara:strand:- start:11218 stop:11601 length:384 start_codon:yes stop_codon:yes gene_type:complete